jgi:hypothetical protein
MVQRSVGFIAVLFCILISGCERNRIAESHRKYDSLFLGISLGMEKQAFLRYCWEQNKKKRFIHGPGNRSVQYKIVELAEPVDMRFYPTFHEGRIFEMPVTFNYESWAPWNREFQSDRLLGEMLVLFKKWYGEDFKRLDHPTMGDVYYRIDDKRRINLFRKDEQYVQAVFTDLKVEKQLKDAYAEKLKTE